MSWNGKLRISSAGSKTRPSVFDIATLRKRIRELQRLSESPDFWSNRQDAEATLSELARLKETVSRWDGFQKALEGELSQLETLEDLVREAGNEESPEIQELLRERAEALEKIDREVNAAEIELFLSGPYDTYDATVSVYAGAGGRDAADWASLLLRMFRRFAERRGWKVRLLHEHRDPEGGVKSATIEVRGGRAYGWLRRENGVHRLVRISPFDASRRRHTSFALVEVLPVFPEATLRDIVIAPDEVSFEAARSSGPGGQNVNRRETAVRLVHLPTGIVVECQAERTQGANRERAMAMLKAKLLARKEEERREMLAREKGKRVEAAWGNQIRSYVLHPYKLVKDHRTGVEHHDPEAVLDGDLDRFIESEITLESHASPSL